MQAAVVLDQVDQRVVLLPECPEVRRDGGVVLSFATDRDRIPNAMYRGPVFIAASPIARSTHRAGWVPRTSQCTSSRWEILVFR